MGQGVEGVYMGENRKEKRERERDIRDTRCGDLVAGEWDGFRGDSPICQYIYVMNHRQNRIN